MARKKYVVSQEGSPVLFEFCKWDNKIDLSRPWILSDYELESTFRGVVDVTLVKLPLVVHRDFVTMTEELWNSL